MKYAISIPWKDRPSYLRLTIATLAEAMNDDGTFTSIPDIVIFNHQSSMRVPGIAEMYASEIVNLKSASCHQVYIDMMNHMFDNYDVDYVLNIDADAIVHPELLNAVEKMVEDLPDVGHGSFYNESCHPEPSETIKGTYTERGHISFLCALLKREAWKMFTPPKPGEEFRFGCVDGMLSTFIHESTPFKVYCTVRSYAQHLGHGGAHSGERDGLCTSSQGRRFYS